MKKILSGVFILAFSATVFAQSYSGGLPLPGLPRSLGPKPMSLSTSVTIASDQNPITVTGTLDTVNNSVGPLDAPAPISATAIGVVDQSGFLQYLREGPQGITVSASQSTIPWVVAAAITNTPTVNQGTTPWVVAAAITNTPSVYVTGGVAITNTPTVNQGTSPWVTSRDWVLQGATDSVGVTGTVTSVPVTATASSVSRVANSASSQSLLVANGARKGVFLYLDSTTNCYVKFGATASTTSFTMKLFSTDTYIMDPPIYTGAIDYICDAATGNMEVSEL